MLYGTILTLHACAMSVALLLFMAAEALLILARSGRRMPARFALLASRLAGPLAGLGMLAGVALVFVGGWSLLTSWLLASFALIAAMMVVERRLVRPWAAQAQSRLSAASKAEIGTVAGDMRALAGRLGMIALFALVAVLMTMKPELNPFA